MLFSFSKFNQEKTTIATTQVYSKGRKGTKASSFILKAHRKIQPADLESIPRNPEK